MNEYTNKRPFRLDHEENIIGPIMGCLDYQSHRDRLHVKVGYPERSQLKALTLALNMAHESGYEKAKKEIRKSLGLEK